MTEHDESLEVGIASGLDVPTAMVISERAEDRPPEERSGQGYNWVVFAAIVLGLAAMILCRLR